MRNAEAEITDRTEIDTIIKSSQAFRLALCDNGRPYIVPLCFGYDGVDLYFHAAKEGEKLNIIRRNPRVCFEFDHIMGVEQADLPCSWGIGYESVIGFGTVKILEDIEEKRAGLTLIMAQYSDQSFTFKDAAIHATTVFKITIESITGKHST